LFWFRTDLDAPRGRVIAIDVTKPSRANWREVIPQAAETLTGVNTLNNSFVCTYLKDAHSQAKIFSLTGNFLREISLPGHCTAGGFAANVRTRRRFLLLPASRCRERFIAVTSRQIDFRFSRTESGFQPADYETKQIFYASKDGTRVPMFIMHKKGIRLDGQNPTLLYGYGGFDISITPSFSVANLVWMEMGDVYAVATATRPRRRGTSGGRNLLQISSRRRILDRGGRGSPRHIRRPFHPDEIRDAERWRYADVETAIAVKQRGILAVKPDAFLVA